MQIFGYDRRPHWNQTSKLGYQLTVIRRPATTVELERLREGVKKENTMHTHISPLDHSRSLDDVGVLAFVSVLQVGGIGVV